MAITLDSGRQYVLSAEITFGFGDITDAGASEPALELPSGAVVIGGELVVETAFDSTTSDVLDIGDGGDVDRYTATPIDLTSLGRTALDLTGYRYTAVDNLDLQWTAGSTGTATAGSATLRVQYTTSGRSNENQG